MKVTENAVYSRGQKKYRHHSEAFVSYMIL